MQIFGTWGAWNGQNMAKYVNALRFGRQCAIWLWATMNTRRQQQSRIAVRAIVVGLLSCIAAMAETSTIFTFTTPAKATSQGQPVDAQTAITVGLNNIHIVLTNLLSNPRSVSQALSSLFFQVDGATTPWSLTGSSATSVNVGSKGTVTNSHVISTGWNLQSAGARMELCDINCSVVTPSQTLIGPPGTGGKYTSANSSIAGNRPHNPFLVGSAVFDLAVTGVTYQSKITNVSFGFGTAGCNYVTGVATTVTTVPEPSAIFLLSTCIAAIALISCRKRITPPTAR